MLQLILAGKQNPCQCLPIATHTQGSVMKEKVIKHDNGATEIQKDGETFYIYYNNGDRVWWNVVDGARIVVRVHTHDGVIWDQQAL